MPLESTASAVLVMLVSVVIPAYNAEQWVAETVQSALRQSHRDLEIILVDDGSSDRTVEIAQKCLTAGETTFRVIRQQNLGAAEARNSGWRAARGTWIQFLDADDLLEPQKIEIQVTKIQHTERVDVVYSNWQKLVLRRNEWIGFDLRNPVICSDALADILSDRNFLQLGSLLFRTSTLAAVGGFDLTHEPIEDVGLCVKVAIAGGHFVKAPSNNPMSSYRDLPRSFSKIDHRRFIESCIKNAKLAEQYVKTNPTCSSRIVDAIVDVYYTGARYYAGFDWKRFEELVKDIEVLRPAFIPTAPKQLNILSRIAGYRKAERLAVLYRWGKRNFESHLRRSNKIS